MGHGGAGNTILGDRAATAAWKLFEPMQYGMHNPADAPVTSPHGLAGRIATAMADMSGCAEMAMLWSEVCHVLKLCCIILFYCKAAEAAHSSCICVSVLDMSCLCCCLKLILLMSTVLQILPSGFSYTVAEKLSTSLHTIAKHAPCMS